MAGFILSGLPEPEFTPVSMTRVPNPHDASQWRAAQSQFGAPRLGPVVHG